MKLRKIDNAKVNDKVKELIPLIVNTNKTKTEVPKTKTEVPTDSSNTTPDLSDEAPSKHSETQKKQKKTILIAGIAITIVVVVFGVIIYKKA